MVRQTRKRRYEATTPLVVAPPMASQAPPAPPQDMTSPSVVSPDVRPPLPVASVSSVLSFLPVETLPVVAPPVQGQTVSKMSSNWQDARLFEDTNFHVLQHELLTDVTFLTGKGRKKVKAHKVILASHSPVFYNMFCGSLVEPCDVIEVPDIEEDIFKDLLRFLYTEECDIVPESVMALIYGAKKYELKRLQEKCMTFLNSGISSENVCLILQHADVFGENELIQKCIDFIFDNATAVLKSGSLVCLSKDVFRQLLESDGFFANEVDIYDSCKDWAAEKLRERGETKVTPLAMRKELGELLFLVRFPLMDQQVFATRTSKEGILTSEEKLEISRSFYSDSSRQNSDLLFNQMSRYSRAKNVTVVRFKDSNYTTDWINSSRFYGLNFKVSRSISCAGVSMFSPSSEGFITGTVGLLDGQNVLTSSKITIDFQKDSQFKDIIFAEAIMLRTDKVYTIRQCMEGAYSFYGEEGLRICTNDSLGMNVEFSNCLKGYSNATSVSSGQIRGLIFCTPFMQK